jgi:glycopeptide antibiotics resistance protein
MSPRLISLLVIFALVAVLGVLQQLAFAYYLYWRFSWYDILMHFLGGVVVGAVYLWVVRYELPAFFKKYETFFYVFAFSLLVGILWEIFEYYVGIDREFSYAVRRIDTVVDLIMDVSGATLSYMVFSRFKHNG